RAPGGDSSHRPRRGAVPGAVGRPIVLDDGAWYPVRGTLLCDTATGDRLVHTCRDHPVTSAQADGVLEYAPPHQARRDLRSTTRQRVPMARDDTGGRSARAIARLEHDDFLTTAHDGSQHRLRTPGGYGWSSVAPGSIPRVGRTEHSRICSNEGAGARWRTASEDATIEKGHRAGDGAHRERDCREGDC